MMALDVTTDGLETGRQLHTVSSTSKQDIVNPTLKAGTTNLDRFIHIHIDCLFSLVSSVGSLEQQPSLRLSVPPSLSQRPEGLASWSEPPRDITHPLSPVRQSVCLQNLGLITHSSHENTRRYTHKQNTMENTRATTKVLIVGGGGTIGSSTALHLVRAGYTPSNLVVLDPYPIPSAQSAGNDLNKIMGIRVTSPMEMQLSLEAAKMWKEDDLFKPWFHSTGRVST